MRVRRLVYVDTEQQQRLAELARRRKLTQSAVLEAAIAAFLAPAGTERLEAATVAVHIERLGHELVRLERHVNLTMETVALFVRFWLTTVPAPPPGLRATGRARYRAFVESLGRRVELGQSVLDDLSEALERQQQAAAGKAAADRPPGTGKGGRPVQRTGAASGRGRMAAGRAAQ